jgi:hypothetical protein
MPKCEMRLYNHYPRGDFSDAGNMAAEDTHLVHGDRTMAVMEWVPQRTRA